MRLGYFMMPLHPPGSDPAETLASDLGQIERLDQLGFEEAWIGEHFTAEWENIPAPDIFIAAALQRTSRLVFGTGVSCMPNHNPFHLAHRIAQLDLMARGRFIWGIGTGSFIGDLEVAGIDPRSGRHRQLTVDAVDQVLQLWNSPQPGLYEQHGWRFAVPEPDPSIAKHVFLKPYQRPHPPIALAGISERSDTLHLAGQRGWIPLSINLNPTRVLQTHWGTVEAGAREAGRTPPSRATWRICRDVHVAETTEQARREAIEGAIGRDFSTYFLRTARKFNRLPMFKQDPAMPDDAVTLEYLLDNVWIVGDPDEVARKIRALHQAVGGFGTLLAIAHDWPDPAVWDRSMRLLAAEVLPHLADLEPAIS